MGNKKKTAEKQAETVTISRAEYEELKLQNQWLLEQLGLAKKRQVGFSSERIQEDLLDQLVLTLNEAEAYAYGTKTASPEQIAVKAHARKRQSGNVLEVSRKGRPPRWWNTACRRKTLSARFAAARWRRLVRKYIER